MSCDVGEVMQVLENEAEPHSPTYIASPTSQLILQPFCRFAYVIAHSTALPLLHLCHSSLSNPSATLPTSQLILQPFRCFTFIISTSPTSQLIFQPFCHFTYVTCHSTTHPLLCLHHRHFTYFTWRAAHAQRDKKAVCGGPACY